MTEDARQRVLEGQTGGMYLELERRLRYRVQSPNSQSLQAGEQARSCPLFRNRKLVLQPYRVSTDSVIFKLNSIWKNILFRARQTHNYYSLILIIIITIFNQTITLSHLLLIPISILPLTLSLHPPTNQGKGESPRTAPSDWDISCLNPANFSTSSNTLLAYPSLVHPANPVRCSRSRICIYHIWIGLLAPP